MASKAIYFLGIDGGGSKCKVRLENENGTLLSEAISGSANVATSCQQSQSSILHATELAFHDAGLALSELKNTYVHAGLAGANIESAYQSMLMWQHPFANFTLSTDMLIACKGAHQHHDGAVIILGTGFCAGYQQQNQFNELGGYGLLLSDGASGGWLGLQLCRKAFEVLDGVAKSSTAIDTLLTQLNCHSSQALSQLLISARPAELAKFAPLIFSHSDDAFCKQLINEACAYIARYISYFEKQGIKKITLMGGIASAITPYLTYASKVRLTPALASAEQGAILMARAAI
ncbi:N-acetylglucosamine kinase [Pseudoalteromonas shioyasakiensis]|uniref:BadF/BadG/BcrA/BcrD ATPase family protein n=1 Tax=Pseudoalteromonas shioyasakiensis TaxID=1190813 RepID=UPI0021174578|nr:BadF/BadG/BcrA/BcrD ATPase family protein [Pseudoalteromonas shioyasakiensis]MCQ8880286.1 N-acetylglucosamine kinase [Pseudoalteromonas shioyasakiensis]